MGEGRGGGIDTLCESELEGGAGVVYPVALLLIEGCEGVKEVDCGFVGLQGTWRARRSGEGAIRGGGTIFHWWDLREGDVYG